MIELKGSVVDEEGLPRVLTFLDRSEEESNYPLYLKALRHNLKSMLPEDFFCERDLSQKLRRRLPLVKIRGSQEGSKNISFFTLSHFRSKSFKFFFELVSQLSVAGERPNVVLIHAADFLMPEISSVAYTLCEIVVRIEDEEKLRQIEDSFSLLETELVMGLESPYIAGKILAAKGLSNDAKTAYIQDMISKLVKKMPDLYEHDAVDEMQYFLLIASEEFKKKRSWRQLARIISVGYLFRKGLFQQEADLATHRTVFLKFFRSFRQNRQILSLVVGLNFLTEKEIFGERQLLRAIHHSLPAVKIVPGSFVVNRRSGESFLTLYIEIEKGGDGRFTSEEIKNLKQELSRDLKSHVEHLMHPLFHPRNEEEIMRNILTLSKEIKYLSDLPQVFITFDQQSSANLFFTVLIVRVGKTLVPIQDSFKKQETFLKYIHDRSKIVGKLRKKHPKEATVFRVKFRKELFLRPDHSIDLSRARQVLVDELTRLLGVFRDFNGGMISKQNQLFIKVKESFAKEKIKFNSVMLENFFYSLTPIVMQTLLEPEAFKALFNLLSESLKKGLAAGSRFDLKMHTRPGYIFVVLIVHERALADELERALTRFRTVGHALASGDISQGDLIATGYILDSDSPAIREDFSRTVEQALE